MRYRWSLPIGLVLAAILLALAVSANVSLGEPPQTSITDVENPQGEAPDGGTPLPYGGDTPPTPVAPSETWMGDDGRLHATPETRQVPGGTWVWTWTALYTLAWVAIRRRKQVQVPVYKEETVTERVQVGTQRVAHTYQDGVVAVPRQVLAGYRTEYEQQLTGWRVWTEKIVVGIRRWWVTVQRGWKWILEKVPVLKLIVERVLVGWRWVARQVFVGWKAVTRWVLTGWRRFWDWWRGIWGWSPVYSKQTEYVPQYRTEYEQQPVYETRSRYQTVWETREKLVPNYVTEERTEPIIQEVTHRDPIYTTVAKTVPVYETVIDYKPVYKTEWVEEPVYETRTSTRQVQVGTRTEEVEVEEQVQQPEFQGWTGSWQFVSDGSLPPDLRRFMADFVKMKIEYWHRVITDGKDTADDWDAEYFQPLREIRTKYLNDPVYGQMVQGVQQQAEAVHTAYARLYQAKEGWWNQYLSGQATAYWEQQAQAARADLEKLDPTGKTLWGVGSPDWRLEAEKRLLLTRFETAYRAYWVALLSADTASLDEAQDDMAETGVSITCIPARNIETQYLPQVKQAYLDALDDAANGDSTYARVQAQQKLAFWREHLKGDLWEQWEADTLPSQGFARSAQELAYKFTALGWSAMTQWAGLIWQVAEEKGLRAEIIAAKIKQESGGDAEASAGPNAGKGLMQVEFGVHKASIPGDTDEEKLAWILEPENNVRFGTNILKGHLDKWIQKWGEDEGLKRGLQYYNYGSGAAEWIEAHSQSPDDWQYWVDYYHSTHRTDGVNTWVVPEGQGNYGNPNHWKTVHAYYKQLLEEPVAPPSSGSVQYDGTQPAPGTTELNAGLPVTPPVTSAPSNRSRDLYDNVINQFAVGVNPRYAKRDSNGDETLETFCNIFVWDVTRAMGVEIPHWVTSDGRPSSAGMGGELTASAIVDWLHEYGADNGWTELSADEARRLANQGKPVTVVWKGSGDGHVAIVRPDASSDSSEPTIAQAGGANFNVGTVSKGFGTRQVEYFAHE